MVDRALSDMRFLERVQEEFEPEEMTEDNIFEWLRAGKRTRGFEIKGMKEDQTIYRNTRLKGVDGKKDLARRLSKTSEVYSAIDEADSTQDLDEIEREAVGLDVHKGKVLEQIDAKRTELELAEQIAQETISDAEVDKAVVESAVKQVDKETEELESEIAADEEQRDAIAREFPDEARALQEDIDNTRERLERRRSEREELLEEIVKQEEIISTTEDKRKRQRAKRRIKKYRARLR